MSPMPPAAAQPAESPCCAFASWAPRDGFANASWVADDPDVILAVRGDRWARFDLARRALETGALTAGTLEALLGDAPLAAAGADAPPPGSWCGWIAYEGATAFAEAPEPLPAAAGDAPDLMLLRPRRVVATRDPAEAARRAADLPASARRRAALSWYREAASSWRLATAPPPESPPSAAPPAPEPRVAFGAAVARVVALIRAGDIYQANLVRRVDVTPSPSPADLFAALGRRAPVSHAALAIDGAGHAVVSHSPELLLRLLPDGRLETRPIKGTRRKPPAAPGAAPDPAASRAARASLVASEKDRAEHLMIVDLERNDLGRLALPGSVAVERLFAPLDLPHLVHLESTVSARPRPGTTLLGALRALFPGGSITGAPKLRAMQVIRELEPVRRGVSMGAVGWLAPSSLHLNVAIRTLTRGPSGRWHFHVGGGIVADSDPEAEWDETEVKAAALLEALEELSAP